jgi:hypothetical protein
MNFLLRSLLALLTEGHNHERAASMPIMDGMMMCAAVVMSAVEAH